MFLNEKYNFENEAYKGKCMQCLMDAVLVLYLSFQQFC